jgi:predicted TIM-barrel fold metal-dependent hydrolase
MEIKHGLISADSHVVLDKDAFTSRMSPAKWGERIPQVVEVEERGRLLHRWSANGEVMRGAARGVCNCPAIMDNPLRNSYPQRWEDVPAKGYVPAVRLEALDEDGVDAEVLFPNDPGSFYQFGDPQFELACVEAYNDALAAWREASNRFIPLAMVPYLSDIATAVTEVERAAAAGHRGIVMLAEPSLLIKGARHISDPYWDPLWAACEATEMPVHTHASGGLGGKLAVPRWDGYTPHQAHSASTIPTGAWPAQLIPNLIFSGIADRFPRLKWVFAETGIGSVNYVSQACDHEWERRHLWTDGLLVRPSEIVKRQMYVNFWYERAGVELRHRIGIENIMWESDYPHIASTYPESWSFVERTLDGVPDEDRKKLQYENAVRVYRL